MKLQSVTSTSSVAMLMLASSVNSLWCSAKTHATFVDVSAPVITQHACKALNNGEVFTCVNTFPMWCCDVGSDGEAKFGEIVHRLAGSAGKFSVCV
jgi:hypothetical protein